MCMQVESVIAEKRALIHSMAALAHASAGDPPRERSELRVQVASMITSNVFGLFFAACPSLLK